MKPESEILDEYASAVYEIYEPEIILHVGEISEKLDTLLTQHGDEMWAFMLLRFYNSIIIPSKLFIIISYAALYKKIKSEGVYHAV